MEVEYDVNDFLIVFLLLRVSHLFKVLIILTRFYGDRADRVA